MRSQPACSPCTRSSLLLWPALLLFGFAACGEAELTEPDDPAVEVHPQSIPLHYYDSASGKTGPDLLRALSARIQGHKALSYSGARNTMFATVADPDNDDVVPCVYTGRRATPVNNTDSANRLSMNTEHSWPQSLGAAGVAQSDLHHLFPTDAATNGRRGNYPYGEVKTVTWAAPNLDGDDGSRLGKDASGRTVFEPQSRVKGDFARAILYFFTRYATQPPSGFTLANFNVEQAVLVRWHEQDPPDDAERKHNDAVFGVQGNRNPYIDHPEYVRAIGNFTK